MASDTASVIADWYHYAILELTRLHDFKPDSRWIAQVLCITPDEVNIAISRLARLGLLQMVDHDRWIDRSGDTTSSLGGFSRSAVERLSEQVRRFMFRALGSAPAGRCEHSSTTLAVATARMPQVMERIARFRRELCSLLEQDTLRDDVYQFEINFFPVTSKNGETEDPHGATGDAVADPGEGAR
jgi:uncharacterized protein (TIGR02147 family)